MSLYKFFESYVEESPELISVRAANSLHYDNLYQFFLNKVTSFLKLDCIISLEQKIPC